MTFDPRSLGCRCDECPLRDSAVPVPPQTALGSPRLIVLGEAPGRAEEEEGKPFVGAAGRQLSLACKTFDVDRKSLHITNTLLCRPPHKGFGPADWRAAIEACRPRLERELEAVPPSVPVFAAGAKALQVLTNKAKITPWVGAPLQTYLKRDVLPSIHPALALRKPALLPVFRIFFGRAVQLADGKLEPWVWPRIEIEPSLAMVKHLESMRGKPIGVDVETAGLDPMHDGLMCIGIATVDGAASIPFPFNHIGVEKIARELLADSSTTKVLQNGGHDLLSLKYKNVDVQGPIFDLLLAHAVAGPQLPHDLGFMAAIEFHAPRWKSEFRVEGDSKGQESFSGRDAGDLRLYNAKDALMQAKLMEPLQKRLRDTHNGQALFDEYTALAELATRMRERGMKVDTERMEHHRAQLTERMEKAEKEFRQLVPDEEFQLGKAGMHQSLLKLFFQTLGVRPTRFTDEGAPQLDASVLEDIVTAGHPSASPIARTVRDFRKAAKLRSTYVDGLPVRNGRVHSITKVHGTISGRFSSADPNMQNVPMPMRDMFIASDE